jgi:serine/threonine protein kinase
MTVYCLNPQVRHQNPGYALRCKDCEYFVKGAQIDDYTITSFLGKGTFGDVYEVSLPEPLRRTYALKVLHENLSSETFTKQFTEEAEKIGKFDHQNILPVYKFGRLENNRPYFIIEYATKTLKKYFAKNDGSSKLADAEELLPFVLQAAQGLEYIHQNGYVHQDIKPVNLLVKGEHLYVADFGTAFYLGIDTHKTFPDHSGTYQYMPVEQLRGKPRRESDQYALAISIFEMLTGHTPFEYSNYAQMWRAIEFEEPPPVQKWNPRIPVEVGAVLIRAMAKDYHHRYLSVLAFAKAYKDAVNFALLRYQCQQCGHQNRSGAQRCSTCGEVEDKRTCPYCDTGVRLGQRCCSYCGRLTILPELEQYKILAGLSLNKGRYVIKRVLKNSDDTNVLVAIAQDMQNHGQLVVVKRWPMKNLTKDAQQYETVSEPLIKLAHPLVPRILDYFIDGQNYHHVMTYMEGESIEERLLKLLKPLPESVVTNYIDIMLNVLTALEKQLPPLHHQYCDITPENIILDNRRERLFLTGFQLPFRATRKLNLSTALSPYSPLEGATKDQRTLMYSLAACAYYALSNREPEPQIGKALPQIRTLNSAVTPELEAILTRALQTRSKDRYQSYGEMQDDIKNLKKQTQRAFY